ncbi:MAG: S8 family serine peptidase [Candidatus Hodarchaeota archaeon]
MIIATKSIGGRNKTPLLVLAMVSLFLVAMISPLFLTFSIEQANFEEPRVSPTLFNHLVASSDEKVRVLIQTETYDYTAIIAAIEKAGGIVHLQFAFVAGLSATLPKSAVLDISRLPGVVKVSLDGERVPASGGVGTPLGGMTALNNPALDRETMGQLDKILASGAATEIDVNEFSVQTLSLAEVADFVALNEPTQYMGPAAMGAIDVWNTGNFGQGSLVAVIDTGIDASHFMLAGSVIGGVDLSPDVGTPYEGATLPTNHWHGTHVAGTVAGHGLVNFGTGALAQSIEFHTGIPAGDDIPLFGMAPAADLYAIKVFPHTGAGVHESIIISGIEHAIDLKVNQGVDVDVISMSLGGGTGYDGRDLEDSVVDYATSVGITVVAAAGNDGPASMTCGSPGTANTAITVGAATHPVNSRVYWEFYYGLPAGLGIYLAVSDDIQMMYFSSRGPTSDGRDKPTLSATGFGVLSSTPNQGLAFAGGTSMATPGVSGAVALLNSVGESLGATPADYTAALKESAVEIPFYDEWETGAGYLDAAGALTALKIGNDHHCHHHGLKSKGHLSKPEGTRILDDNHHHHDDTGTRTYTTQINNLFPGHVKHWWFKATKNTQRVTVEFSNVQLGADVFGLDSFEFHLMSAMRTSDSGYHLYSVNVWGDALMVAEDLNSTASGYIWGVNTANLPMMNGYYRISVENDFTSSDIISGTMTVTVEDAKPPRADEKYKGRLNTGDSTDWISVGWGTAGVQLELSWKGDWSRYPTSDLDMVVAWWDTTGVHYDYSGGTFSSPEMVRIISPDLVQVWILVDGYETYGFKEKWTLEVIYL